MSDRGRLAQTCRALEAAFCHPSVWNTVTIESNTTDLLLHGFGVPYRPSKSLPMVKRFGAYFKDLSLTLGFDGTMQNQIPRECEDLIQCIKRCCRYERLTLDAFSYERVMRPTDLNILAQLFTNQHLKSIALLGVTCKDVRVLLSHRLNGCLERLSIQEHGEDTKLRFPILASQLTRLRALHLRSFGVSDDLIVSLADPGRAPLR